MRVLVGCEFSGTVRDAFRAKGYEAWSCDLLPHEGDEGGYHLEGDVRWWLDNGWNWDLFIAHPPCTYMANSGALRLYRGGKKTNGRDLDRWAKMERAAQFFLALWSAPIERICIENPVMVGYAQKIIGADYTQTIQPYQFGHPESKRTCLWLKGLPALNPTDVLTLPVCGHWANQIPSGQNKFGPSPDRWKLRATTYQGIAEAMAEQWNAQ